jgi:hypothetical protein
MTVGKEDAGNFGGSIVEAGFGRPGVASGEHDPQEEQAAVGEGSLEELGGPFGTEAHGDVHQDLARARHRHRRHRDLRCPPGHRAPPTARLAVA